MYIEKCKKQAHWYILASFFSHLPISIVSIVLGTYVMYAPNIPNTRAKHISQYFAGGNEIFWGSLSLSGYIFKYEKKSFWYAETMRKLQEFTNRFTKLNKDEGFLPILQMLLEFQHFVIPDLAAIKIDLTKVTDIQKEIYTLFKTVNL